MKNGFLNFRTFSSSKFGPISLVAQEWWLRIAQKTLRAPIRYKTFMQHPKYEGLIIYLDHNVVSSLASPRTDDDRTFKIVIEAISQLDNVCFPFSTAHLSELKNVPSENAAQIEEYLKILTKISKSIQIQYNENINFYTLKQDSDPTTVFKALVEIERPFQNLKQELDSAEAADALKGVNIDTDFLEDIELLDLAYSPEAVLDALEKANAQESHSYYDIDKRHLGALDPQAARHYIDEKIRHKHQTLMMDTSYREYHLETFGTLEPLTAMGYTDYAIGVVNKQIPEIDGANHYIRHLITQHFYELMGYKPEKGKNSSRRGFWDRIHMGYGKAAQLFITDDERLIKVMNDGSGISITMNRGQAMAFFSKNIKRIIEIGVKTEPQPST